MAKEYNGHKNWNQWNVALWLYNDEHLYGIVCEAIESSSRLTQAALRIQARVPKNTPDGARYSLVAIKNAIEEDFETHLNHKTASSGLMGDANGRS